MTDQLDQTFPEPASGPRAGNRALSVMDRVREAILDGSISAGERLNEVQLSKTLAVSRTPVRAALQALAGEGLLDYAPNRGFTVREFPLPAIVDAYDIRASLEGVAVRFAAERGLGAQEREIIERSLAAGDKLLERGSFEAGDLTIYRDINGDFHDALLAAAAQPDALRDDPDLPSRPGVVEPQHRGVRISRRPPPPRRSSPYL